MGRLIDADSAIERVKAQGAEHPNAYPLTHYAELILSEAPTVDAVPVRRGRWEYGSAWYPPTCSICGLTPLTPGYVGDVNFYSRYFKRCPHCGAKMDYVNENEN